MAERFVVQQRRTDSGRSRFWYVMDRHALFPPWCFGDLGGSEANRALARTAARMLNASDFAPVRGVTPETVG